MNHDKKNDDFWSAINRIEVSVKNSQENISRIEGSVKKSQEDISRIEGSVKSAQEDISRIEVSVKNSQEDIRRLYLHSTRHEIALESLNHKVDASQQENRERFDKIEDTLAVIVTHLQK